MFYNNHVLDREMPPGLYIPYGQGDDVVDQYSGPGALPLLTASSRRQMYCLSGDDANKKGINIVLLAAHYRRNEVNMNRRTFVKVSVLASVVGLEGFLAACQGKAPTPTAVVPSATPTLLATSTALPTNTPTNTLPPTATATAEATVTSVPTKRPDLSVNYGPTVAVIPNAKGRIIFAPFSCGTEIYHQGTFRGTYISTTVYYAFDVAAGTKIIQPVDNYSKVEFEVYSSDYLAGVLVITFTMPEGSLHVFLPSATSAIDMGKSDRLVVSQPYKAGQPLATINGPSEVTETEGYNIVMAATDTDGKYVDLSYFSWDVKGPACRPV
jgi:hypothetical protein